ncbi:MAG: hypothetical protein PHU12_00490 [Candidatus Aenigmarchaeota archaeon]|nr:hypothetical protein [Candidatus Aenigmarchaeota archaeon]
MIPKIIFRYSWIYNQRCKDGTFGNTKEFGKYPTDKQIIIFKNKIETIWRKKEKVILKKISNISGLKWREKYIQCYIVGRVAPLSDPLTICIYTKHPDYFIDVLTHELIHQIFVQNHKNLKNVWKYFFYGKYKKESHTTCVHIPLHAIHTAIYKELFNEICLNRDIRICQDFKDYKKSWQIVKKEGYQNIIKEFRNRIIS